MAEVIGGPFNIGVRSQLDIRNNKYSKLSGRTNDDLRYLTSKTGWVKLTSGVDIGKSEAKAKEYVLIGGTINRFGDAAYSTYTGKGGKGFRPMPGITGMQLRTTGQIGVFKEATVTFNCWDVDQITDLELLYMRPGFTVLLEWGHSIYYTSETALDTVPLTVSQMFTRTGKVDGKDKLLYAGSKESIVNEIEKLKRESNYNYDGILGVIKNFSWSFRPDGGYDCTTTLITLGELVQSLPIDTDVAANTEDKTPTSSTYNQLATMIESVLTTLANGLGNGTANVINNYPDYWKKYKTVNGDDTLTSVYSTAYSQTNTSYEAALLIGQKFAPGTVVTQTSTNFNFVWVSLQVLCKIVNAALLIDENDNNILKLNTKTGRAKFRTFNEHISSDPKICMIATLSALQFVKGLSRGEATINIMRDQITGTADDVLNVYVNIDVVREVLTGLRNQPKDSRTLENLMKPILQRITEALGNINNFDLHYEEDELTYYIVDRMVKPDKATIPTLQITGLKSTVSQFNFTTKLSPAITTMLAVSAQGTVADLGLEAEALLAWNKGLTDRIISQKKQRIEEQDTAEITAQRSKAQEQRKEKFNMASFNLWNYNTYSVEEFETARNAFTQYATTYLQFTEAGIPAGIVPFEVQVQMEGISGMKVGQVFKINDGIMPNYYRGVVGFIVTGIDHDVKDNRWTTGLRAQTVIIGEGKAKKAVPVKEEQGLQNNRQSSSSSPPNTGGSIPQGNDADFWALLAVCALEDGDSQGRADVAQSIYNRLGSGKYQGTTLKTLITNKWQYEPAFQKAPRNGTVAQEWKNIKDKDTAIIAIRYTKGWSDAVILRELKETYEAIKNPTYQENAKTFIQGRTDFLSENQGLPAARNKRNPLSQAIMRVDNRPNNVFAWNFNYKTNTLYPPPPASWFNSYASEFTN
jgi:hypothetical protein